MVVDDSVLFRKHLSGLIESYPDLEVVANASDGVICLQELEKHQIDLVVLDIEMPRLDGLETVRKIRHSRNPVKVIIISSLGVNAREMTISALSAGADDFVPKPQGGRSLAESLDTLRETLIPKITQFHRGIEAPLKRSVAKTVSSDAKQSSWPKLSLAEINPDIIVIASSTGGPRALGEFFSGLKDTPNLPPILIAQHMPPMFTENLAKRLGKESGLDSQEAKDGEYIERGRVYVAPGDNHLEIKGSRIVLHQNPLRNSVRPAADFLFESAADSFEKSVLALVFTGMGEDGLDGSIAVKNKGGFVAIQDRESSTVWGMPGSVYQSNAYDYIFSLEESPRIVRKICRNLD